MGIFTRTARAAGQPQCLSTRPCMPVSQHNYPHLTKQASKQAPRPGTRGARQRRGAQSFRLRARSHSFELGKAGLQSEDHPGPVSSPAPPTQHPPAASPWAPDLGLVRRVVLVQQLVPPGGGVVPHIGLPPALVLRPVPHHQAAHQLAPQAGQGRPCGRGSRSRLGGGRYSLQAGPGSGHGSGAVWTTA